MSTLNMIRALRRNEAWTFAILAALVAYFSISAPGKFLTVYDITQIAGLFTCFNCSITGVSAYGGPNGSDAERTITITFTTTVSTPVLAWGGHIANEIDWGAGNGAGSVNGSSYHMRTKGLDGSGGNQDRSLKASALRFNVQAPR